MTVQYFLYPYQHLLRELIRCLAIDVVELIAVTLFHIVTVHLIFRINNCFVVRT